MQSSRYVFNRFFLILLVIGFMASAAMPEPVPEQQCGLPLKICLTTPEDDIIKLPDDSSPVIFSLIIPGTGQTRYQLARFETVGVHVRFTDSSVNIDSGMSYQGKAVDPTSRLPGFKKMLEFMVTRAQTPLPVMRVSPSTTRQTMTKSTEEKTRRSYWSETL